MPIACTRKQRNAQKNGGMFKGYNNQREQSPKGQSCNKLNYKINNDSIGLHPMD